MTWYHSFRFLDPAPPPSSAAAPSREAFPPGAATPPSNPKPILLFLDRVTAAAASRRPPSSSIRRLPSAPVAVGIVFHPRRISRSRIRLPHRRPVAAPPLPPAHRLRPVAAHPCRRRGSFCAAHRRAAHHGTLLCPLQSSRPRFGSSPTHSSSRTGRGVSGCPPLLCHAALFCCIW